MLDIDKELTIQSNSTLEQAVRPQVWKSGGGNDSVGLRGGKQLLIYIIRSLKSEGS